jgi:hypothetical protein
MAGIGRRPSLGFGAGRWLTRLALGGWAALRPGGIHDEAVLATLGQVQVRKTRAGVVACTVVRGEPGATLQTAMARLANYVRGDNREGLQVPAARPVVQRPGGPGRWHVQIRLPGVYTQFSAPMPRDSKIRIMMQPSETLAVVRLAGQPRPAARARGEAAVLSAIAGSGWIASGESECRLHAPPGLLPWTGGFEIALPVSQA